SPTTLPTTATPTDNAVTLYGTSLPYFNINNIGFTTVEYSPGYDLTPAAAPNAAGAQGYEFPVFIYDESTDAFDCTELTTLDGFSPAAMDNCGILRIDPIESLFDYGLDGDFGDDNSALFPTSPLIPQTFAFNNDLATPAYELESVLTAGLTTATDDNDDLAAGTNPFNCSFYEYDLLRRWRVVDNCGFQSVAQRIYHIRDREAPAISSATITVGGSPIFYTAALTAETMSTLNTPNIRTYSLNSTINIVSNDCMPVLDILANTLDNCADNQYLNISYAVNTLNNNALPVQVASGNLVNGNTMIPLPVNGTYTVVVSYNDPCGNVSNLEVDVTTTQTDNPLNFNSLFNTEIGTTGAGAVDFFDIAPPSQVQEFLSNLCNLPSCVELVVRGTNAFGAPLEDRAFYQVDQNNATLIGIGTTNDPSIILTCDDIGSVKQVSVEIYEETNCNFTTTPISTNVGSVSTLLETRTSTVTVTGPAVSPFSVSTSSVPASSNVATDGSINVTITPASSTPTQLYDITYTGPVSGSLTGINLAASNPTTINGLSEGSYTITVRGQTSCLTETTVVNLGTGMPANATLSCPTNVTTGPTSFTLLAGTGFSNITSLSLQVSLTGPAGVDIPSASLVGAFATNVNGQGGVFGLSDDPFTPNTFNVLLSVPLGSGVSAASGDPLISFQLDVPATANVGDVISVVVTGTALQSTGFGTPSTSVPFNGSNCSISVAATSSGTLGASGQVMYMYCGAPVENVQVTLTSTNPTQSSFTDLNGNYGFSSIIQSGTSITITPSLMSFNSSGTTYLIDGGDLSALLSLLLTATPISPYQLVAADIDGDGALGAADAILLLNNINTSNATFLNSWIFVNANQTLNAFSPTPAANLETSFTDATFTSSAPIDFIAVKPGDILPDCTTGSGVVIRGVTPMVTKDRAITKGESYELDFNLRDFDGVKAFQTVLNFDPSVVKPTEVIISEKLKAAGLTDVVIESSSIRLLGASADAIDLAAEDALISVRFEAVKSARSLKTAFAVSQENPSLIFNDGADGTDRYQLILLFDDKDTTPSTLEVYGSYPNPFNTTTSIQFGLSQSDLVQLTVTDVTGRVVYELNAQFDAGQNQIDLNAADLKASGLLIYTIRTSDTKYSDKLLLVE
ncbi:MAG: T9SS type A sorting domain-containing protein, partial [Bacteroidota bacterium]